MRCYNCGERLIHDPDGSLGVVVHEERGTDIWCDPVPEEEEDE